MIGFIVGFLIGCFIGIFIMAMLQIAHEDKEDK